MCSYFISFLDIDTYRIVAMNTTFSHCWYRVCWWNNAGTLPSADMEHSFAGIYRPHSRVNGYVNDYNNSCAAFVAQYQIYAIFDHPSL